MIQAVINQSLDETSVVVLQICSPIRVIYHVLINSVQITHVISKLI